VPKALPSGLLDNFCKAKAMACILRGEEKVKDSSGYRFLVPITKNQQLKTGN
jgi:hypothetical protein